MFKDKKGQSALEYLMTYGWALVVIVIVIAALFAFGVFNTPKQCTATGGKIFLKDFDFNAGSIQLTVKNTNPNAITINSFTGSPDPLTWVYGGSVLAKTDENTFLLEKTSGTFSGNITEDITINYTVTGGITKDEKTTCSGTV